jgi:type II secretion system protein G
MRQGFTLIELMIVIAIIGVLAAIAVPNFKRARERANTRACYANQKTIAGAVEMYNLDNNTIAGIDSGTCNQLVSAGYLQSMPSDPGGGAAFTYAAISGGNGISCSTHGQIQEAATAAS